MLFVMFIGQVHHKFIREWKKKRRKREIKYKQYNIIFEIIQRKKIVRFVKYLFLIISRIKDNY